MTIAVLLIELTALAGLATAGCGLVLYFRDRSCSQTDTECAGVQRSPRGRLFGVPNTAIGIVYYVGVIVAFALPESGLAQIARGAAALASLAAAALSIFLLWSLMAITRRACRVCLAGNSINLFLAGLVMGVLAVDQP